MSRYLAPNRSWLIVFTFFLASFAFAAKSSVDEQKAGTRKMASETLKMLYEVYPNSRHGIESSFGYAVFSNFGMKILFAGGGSGKGIAVDNEKNDETFMKMLEVQAGLGMGVKKFRVIFIFQT